MRFLHLIGTMDPAAGGPTESVRLLLSEGYTGEAVCFDAPDAPFLAAYDFPVHALGPVPHPYGFTLHLNLWLHRNLHRFDCVVVNGLWGYQGLAVLEQVRGRLPYFVFPHGMLDPYFKRRYPAKHLKKWLYWMAVEYRLLASADRVFFTSEAESRLATQTFAFHRWRGQVVPYGAARPPADSPELRDAFLERCPGVRRRRFLLFLGRLHPKKGCDLLVEAFARTAALDPGVDLVMAGPDDMSWAAQLRQQAQRLGIAQRVHWPGMLDARQKYGALYSAEAFVLPSHQENFGIAAAEALSCGTPALLSNQVNVAADIVSDGAGLMKPDTLDGTRELLAAWKLLPIDRREQMRNAALATAEARYRMDRTAAILLDHARRAQTQPARAVPTTSRAWR